MRIAKVGLILFTDRYVPCVDFYRDVVGLRAMDEREDLSVFEFGSGYLMVERGGPPAAGPRTRDRNPTVLRFNVPDVGQAAADLEAKGVAVAIRKFDWGTIGVFHDPDGNRCELKNDA